MARASFSKVGLTISLFFVVLYLLCLGWEVLLTNPALRNLHHQLLSLGFPGFVWFSFGSFIWGLVLSFIYGWVGAVIFVWLRRLCCGSKE